MVGPGMMIVFPSLTFTGGSSVGVILIASILVMCIYLEISINMDPELTIKDFYYCNFLSTYTDNASESDDLSRW